MNHGMSARFWVAGLLAAVILASMPISSVAHGPTRQKVKESVEINASADKVWGVIGNFQEFAWHPAVEKTEGDGGNDVGATRKLILGGGGVIDEKLNRYSSEKKSYSYEITEVDVKVLPVNNYSSTLSVEDKDGKSVVTWKGAFYRGYMNNNPPPELNEETAIKAVTGIYKSGLESLKTQLEAGG